MRHDTEQAAFVLTKPDLRALLAFASRDKTRRHLCGVYFNPREGYAAAADGHALVRARNCGQADVEPFIVGRDELEAARRLLKKRTDVLHVRHPADGIGVAVLVGVAGNGETLGRFDATVLDAVYPPIDGVIPHDGPDIGAPVPVQGFNALLLERVSLMQKAAGAIGCRFRTPHHELDPTRVDCSDVKAGTDWTAVIMPMRT